MNYNELINEYINKSGLALGVIAEKMGELGVKVDRSYLSKLRTNAKYPASEEVNRAIATVTGSDPDELVFAAFLDKAPKIVKHYFSKINDVNSYLKQFAEVSKDNNLQQLLEVISQDEKFELFKIIAEDALAQGKDISDFLNSTNKHDSLFAADSLKEYDSNYMIKIPILGENAVGQSIDCIENIEGYTSVEQSILRGRKGFALTVKGGSMIGDRIYDGDTVIIAQQPEVSSSDIAAVRIDKGEITLKRVKIYNEYYMLTASNPTVEPALVPTKNIEILGKVVEVRFLLS